jgi:hypothetical protein
MPEILTEAQLLATFSGPQPEQIAMANLIRTLFANREGTVAADDPPAGVLGEELSAEVLVGDAVALVTNTAKTVVSLELTAGDWDLSGVVSFLPAATTSITKLSQSISSTTNVHGNNKNKKSLTFTAVVPNDTLIADTPVVRVNLSATTTYYLIALATFTVDTLSAYGYLRARRVR